MGSAAIDRPTKHASNNATWILGSNPANATGKIATIEIFAVEDEDMTDVTVAIFTETSTNVFTARDSQLIGTVTGGSKNVFSVDLDVVEGDYIGLYWNYGRISYNDSDDDYWVLAGDQTSCVDTTFPFYSELWDVRRTFSLHGTHPTVPEYSDIPTITFDITPEIYFKETYGEKDVEGLRQKCIDYEEKYVNFCLTMNHNTKLIKNFLQEAFNNGEMGGENEMFFKIYPPQQLKPLYFDSSELNDFKEIINIFINSNTSNSIGLNHNIDLLNEWLNDYYYTSDGYKANYINPRIEIIKDKELTIEYLKKKVDDMSREISNTSNAITHNFNLIKEIIY